VDIATDLLSSSIGWQALPVPPRPGRLVEHASITKGVGIADALQVQVEAKIPGHEHRHLRVTVWFVTRSEQRVPLQVAIHPTQSDLLPSNGINYEALRAVQLGAIQRELSELLTAEVEGGWVPAEIVEGFRSNPRPGSRGRPHREYAAVAAMYVRLLGTSKTPLRALVDELGPGYTAAAVRAMLNRARKHGLLTSAPSGRAGGELTEKARALLAEGADTST
jgi:hypothetical protein